MSSESFEISKSSNSEPEYAIGTVVLPARDGTLSKLGLSIVDLGLRALGLVVEVRGSKALVFFPELKLSLWLDKNEIADTLFKAQQGEPAFAALIPNSLNSKTPLVWWLSHLCRTLPVFMILGYEVGRLSEIWDAGQSDISKYYTGPTDVPAAYLGLGLKELLLEDWRRIEESLGPQLLFARFLPAGMHKLEVAIFFRAA